MKACLASLALLCALASPAMADIFGLWRVQGAISGNPFVLDCRFVPAGTGLAGTCTGAKNDPKIAGKIYTITQGAIAGSQVSFSYPSHYLFMSFQVSYRGTLAGSQIAGTVTAAGRQGKFTAARE